MCTLYHISSLKGLLSSIINHQRSWGRQCFQSCLSVIPSIGWGPMWPLPIMYCTWLYSDPLGHSPNPIGHELTAQWPHSHPIPAHCIRPHCTGPQLTTLTWDLTVQESLTTSPQICSNLLIMSMYGWQKSSSHCTGNFSFIWLCIQKTCNSTTFIKIHKINYENILSWSSSKGRTRGK